MFTSDTNVQNPKAFVSLMMKNSFGVQEGFTPRPSTQVITLPPNSTTLEIIKSETSLYIKENQIESFMMDLDIMTTNMASKTNPFHIKLLDHPLKFEILQETGDLKEMNFFRVKDKTSGSIYYFKFFPINGAKHLMMELAVIRYLTWGNSELKKNPKRQKEIKDFFLEDKNDLFVSLIGLGNEILRLKEGWFSKLLMKTPFITETPVFWTLSEPGLYNLRTVFNTMRKEKSKIPLYFGWTFLIKLSQILMNLKNSSIGHLDIKPENLYIITRVNDQGEHARILEGIKYLKIGGFGSAVLLPENQQLTGPEGFSTNIKYGTIEIENKEFLNPYKADMYSIGVVMKEVIDFMEEKFYGHVINKNNKKYVLKEKTKGLLKSLVSRMVEPIHTRIEIEELWGIVCNHTEALLAENPQCFELKHKNKSRPSFLNESLHPVVSDGFEVPMAIYHAFNMKYHHIDDKLLKFIKECGFSHIQISPTQKSHEYGAWHDKYQPEDYVVKNRYGNANDLKNLTSRAHAYGLKIIADIVFNHMGGIGWFTTMYREKYENNKQGYYKYRKDLIKTYGHVFFKKGSNSNPDHYFTEWNEDGWHGGNLPQLNTMHPDVKTVQINYLKLLRSLGVDGFRFDAIKTIDKQSLRDYVAAVGDKWLYGEYVSCDPHQNFEFTPIMPITDFVLLDHLRKVFCIGGSFRDLRVPRTNCDPRSVIFALNHDTWAAKNSWFIKTGIDLTFDDDKDADLATLFILARHGGVPLILKDDINKPSIQAGVKFRREMHNRNAPMEVIDDWVAIYEGCNLDDFLLMQRGQEGLFILNKSISDIQAPKGNVSAYSCAPGYYVNPEDESLWRVYESDKCKYLVNQKGDFFVPKRSGIFLIKIQGV